MVIGGGLSGLGAAMILRSFDHEVILIEKSNLLAPLVRGFSRQGLAFETGFHYAGGLGKDGVLYRYLDRLGLIAQGLETLPLPDRAEILRFPDGDVAIPGQYDDFRALFPKKHHIDDFFNLSRLSFNRSPYLNHEISSFDSRHMNDEGPTLANQLNALDLPQKWQDVLGFRCFLYGVRPSESSFVRFSVVNVPYLDGGYSFKGGGLALVQSFEKALRAAGVKLLTGREVTAIKTNKANAVEAVIFKEADGHTTEVDCDSCIYSGHPAALPYLLPQGSLRPVLAKRLAALKETPLPLMLFAHTGSAWLAGRQLFIAPGNGLDFWLDARKPLIYVSGGPGDNGRWPVSAMTLLPPEALASWQNDKNSVHPPDYYEFKKKAAEALRLRILNSCPELNGDLEIAEAATGLTLKRYSFNSGFSIYGKSHSIHEAPVLPLTRVGGLSLAGQNIVMPGLLGVMVSSALAAGCLTGHQPVLEFFRKPTRKA